MNGGAHIHATPDSGRVYINVVQDLELPGCIFWRDTKDAEWQSAPIASGQYHKTIGGLSTRSTYEMRFQSAQQSSATVRIQPSPARSCYADGYYNDARLLVLCSDADVRTALSRWPHWSGAVCNPTQARFGDNEGTHSCRWTLAERDIVVVRAANDEDHIVPLVDPSVVRRIARKAIWGSGGRESSPASRKHMSTVSVQRDTLLIQLPFGLASRVIIRSALSRTRGIVLWLEGHGGDGTDIGADDIAWFTERGFLVYAIDMLLTGRNGVDQRQGLATHDDIFRQAQGGATAVATLLEPLQILVDWLETEHTGTPIILAGRSGGGWTANTYGAVDERIAYVISIAAGVPSARRIADLTLNLGDAEQYEPTLYGRLEHELFAAAAGHMGAFHTWSELDECCLRLPASSQYPYALEAFGRQTGRRVRALVQAGAREHGITPSAQAELERELNALFP
jgi:hypothetical protein